MIQQAINALEDWRKSHHHLHKDVAEVQVHLRDDICIWTIEWAAKHNEPMWVDSARILKASSTSYGG